MAPIDCWNRPKWCAGLGIAAKVKPDVAFIDIKMPVLTGLELAKKIKDEHMKTEVVLVSAYQEFEYAKQGIELGICQYILKHEVGRFLK